MSKINLRDYEIMRTIGTGSFGRVKLAKCRLDGNFYALKFMKKHEIIKLRQVDHINGERKMMSVLAGKDGLGSPFLVNMRGYTSDSRYVIIAMEMVYGGELFTHLRKKGKFEDSEAKFYAGIVTLAFEYMHARNIVHRDLKPENVLVGGNGYAKLTDFGFAKIIEPGDRTYTLCGTPEYIAPEVLLNKGHAKAVDWWTLGILIYELIAGHAPFIDDDPMGIYQQILACKLKFSRDDWKNSSNAKSLVKRLLQLDLSKRYGNLKGGAEDVKCHKWFASEVGFLQKLQRLEVTPPWKPNVKHETDTSNFEKIPESQNVPDAVPKEKDPFIDW